MHGKEIVPYCIPNHPVFPPLSHTQSEITALQPAPPTRVKMNALTTCGGSRTREWEKDVGEEEREGKDVATVQGGESVKQDSQTPTLIVYMMSNLIEA